MITRRQRLKRNFYFFMMLYLIFPSPEILAQTFPQGFSQVEVVHGLRKPTVMTFLPDGRILVAEQEGKLWIIKDGQLLKEPAIALKVDAAGERGLIGMAIDPDFATNQYIYLYHTLPDGSRNSISRFTLQTDKIQSASEKVVLELDPLSSATNHNGGAMHFGRDGKLYVAIGENAHPANAQNLNTYFGKMLRINPDGSVPEGNPFPGGSEQKKRIWAYGLRNPYTFDIQPGTGKIWINDVGEKTWEEINDASQGGLNFGWPAVEGKSDRSDYENPVYSYPRGDEDGKGCAITGGAFFDPDSTNYPEAYKGKYFFQDYCSGWMNALDFSGQVKRESFATDLGERTISLTVGSDGNLYYLNRRQGAVFKIIYTQIARPSITRQPVPLSVSEGEPATFEVSASGAAPLHYQWQKDRKDIAGATEAIYSIDSTKPSDTGDYRVIVSNGAGKDTSREATLTVEAYNAAPVAAILTPAEDVLYQAGDTLYFSGEATDEEDGVLPDSAFNWLLEFHHDEHVHDGPPVAEGVKSGSVTIPNTGETSTNVWYRLYLVVVDVAGLTDTTYRDIYPKKSILIFNTEPAGLEVMLDGHAIVTPDTLEGVVGMIRTIGVVSPQILDSVTWLFDRWAQGGDVEQTIVIPEEDVAYTAIFKKVIIENPDSVTAVDLPMLFKDSVMIFPNPAEDVIYIKGYKIAKDTEWQLVDISGKSISLHLVDEEKDIIKLRIPVLKRGLYTLMIRRGNRILSEKIMIQP